MAFLTFLPFIAALLAGETPVTDFYVDLCEMAGGEWVYVSGQQITDPSCKND